MERGGYATTILKIVWTKFWCCQIVLLFRLLNTQLCKQKVKLQVLKYTRGNLKEISKHDLVGLFFKNNKCRFEIFRKRVEENTKHLKKSIS